MRKNSERGAEKLVVEYGNRLYAAAVLLCDNDQDAVELVFNTIDESVKNMRQFVPGRNLFTWLYAIMLDVRRINLHRRRIGEASTEAAECEQEQTVEMQPDEQSHEYDIENAIRALPPLLREVTVMRYCDGMASEEIAATLDIPVGAVKARLYHACEALMFLFPGHEEAEIDLALAARVRDCVAAKHLPKGFSDRLLLSVRRSRRMSWFFHAFFR